MDTVRHNISRACRWEVGNTWTLLDTIFLELVGGKFK